MPLEKGRAYRGYVWATSGMLSGADTVVQNGTSFSSLSSSSNSENNNDGVALVLEVSIWKLLARTAWRVQNT